MADVMAEYADLCQQKADAWMAYQRANTAEALAAARIVVEHAGLAAELAAAHAALDTEAEGEATLAAMEAYEHIEARISAILPRVAAEAGLQLSWRRE